MGSKEIILGIDPGINSVGISISSFDYDSELFSVISAYTLKPMALTKDVSPMPWEDLREYKLSLIQSEIVGVVEDFGVGKVCIENNFLQNNADAYKSLIECVCSIKLGIELSDHNPTFHVYEASVVKATMGVSGDSGDKDLMKKSLFSRPDIIFDRSIDLEELDEHSVDSICIAFHHAKGNFVLV